MGEQCPAQYPPSRGQGGFAGKRRARAHGAAWRRGAGIGESRAPHPDEERQRRRPCRPSGVVDLPRLRTGRRAISLDSGNEPDGEPA